MSRKDPSKTIQTPVDYHKGLYKVLDRIRAKPSPREVNMMLCSGGGGRVDYEALKCFTEFWLSDNADPMEYVYIQWENSPLLSCDRHCNHVTDWSNAGMKYRCDSYDGVSWDLTS
ncbi:MAG: alpha-galactosidase [Saprospiraceae bacterium]|nr:alpha-galactosidase [Saprospiraceae bacterium]